MSHLKSRTTQRARQLYKCDWCLDLIPIGQYYVKYRGNPDGVFQTDRRHLSCTPEAITQRAVLNRFGKSLQYPTPIRMEIKTDG